MRKRNLPLILALIAALFFYLAMHCVITGGDFGRATIFIFLTLIFLPVKNKP